MTDGVSIKPRFSTIYFDDIHSKTLEGVEEEKRKCQETVQQMRERLAMLIAGNPKDLMGREDWDEYTDPTSWITWQINEIEEQLQEAIQKYGELNVYESLLDEWTDGRWSTEASWEDIYEDVLKTSDSKLVFPEEQYADTEFKHDLLFGRTKLEDSSIEEAFERGLSNVKLDEGNANEINNKVFAKIDGKLFVTYKGQWLFTSEEQAMKAVMHRLNIPVLEYFKTDFIKSHPEFFDSINKWLDNEESEKFKSYIEDIDNIQIMSSKFTNMYDLFIKGMNRYISSRVKFYNLGLTINSRS